MVRADYRQSASGWRQICIGCIHEGVEQSAGRMRQTFSESADSINVDNWRADDITMTLTAIYGWGERFITGGRLIRYMAGRSKQAVYCPGSDFTIVVTGTSSQR